MLFDARRKLRESLRTAGYERPTRLDHRMSDDPDLEDLLPGDTVDAGCAASFDVLHRYVEDELSGGDRPTRNPGWRPTSAAAPPAGRTI